MNARLGRNDPCACGSGKKHKKCCGAAAPEAVTRPLTITRADMANLAALVNSGRHYELERRARELLTIDSSAGIVWKVLGYALWTQGRDAVPALTQAAALLPNDAEAHTNLGNALRAAGRRDAAEACHRRALRLDPRSAEACNNLGSVLRDLGRFTEAVDSFRAAERLRAGFATAGLNLGDTLCQLERPKEAVLAYRRALTANPALVEAHTRLGDVLQNLGELAEAANSYRQATEFQPLNAELHVKLGDALRNMWHLNAAADSYRQAITLRADYAEAHNRLGNTLYFLGQHEEAAASCRCALAIDPNIAEMHANLGTVLLVQNRAAEAEASCRRGLELEPNLTGALVLLADIHSARGQFSESEALLKQALAIEPDMPEALAGLVRWRKVTADDTHWLAAAERVVSQNILPRREVQLRYALGKYYDDTRDFERAFSNYHRANELTRLHNAPYDRDGFSRRIDLITQTYDRDWFERTAPAGDSSRRPVFILGMWRSGTTLTEQILASHPDVFGAGELTYWGNTLAALERSAPSEDRDDQNILGQLARDYLDVLHRFSPDAPHVTDKMCSNFLHLGLIRAAFPNARIIHVRRDPIDTCLSIYFQNLHFGHRYANDLGDLAHYYAEYLRVMRHWSEVIDRGAILDVPYEGLVADQLGWTRTMLDFIGLPWSDRCVDFHRTDRTVTTVSKWQVRQRISKGSVERWRNYEQFLAPLLHLSSAVRFNEQVRALP